MTAPPQGKPAREGIKSAWVIEEYNKTGNSSVKYWAGTGVRAGDFSHDLDKAIQFSRIQDAETVMNYILHSQTFYRVSERLNFISKT